MRHELLERIGGWWSQRRLEIEDKIEHKRTSPGFWSDVSLGLGGGSGLILLVGSVCLMFDLVPKLTVISILLFSWAVLFLCRISDSLFWNLIVDGYKDIADDLEKLTNEQNQNLRAQHYIIGKLWEQLSQERGYERDG